MDFEQKVEQRAKANSMLAWPGCQWGNVFNAEPYRRIARAELEREEKLVEALKCAMCFRGMSGCECSGCAHVRAALAAYEAEFAPKPRAIREVAKDIAAQHDKGGTHFYAISEESMDELRAALAREGGE